MDVMKWKIIPVSGGYEYSDEVKQFACEAALKAALDTRIEFCDVENKSIAALGKKWEVYFLHAYGSLRHRYGNHIDDLVLLSDRLDKFAATYDASLRQRAAELLGSPPCDDDNPTAKAEICGALLAQHYTVACEKELLKGTSFKEFPGTGDVLAALSINRIMQAALAIDEGLEKVLDLISDAMAAKFLFTQGQMHLEHFFTLKNDRKDIAKKVAASGGAARAAKIQALKDKTIELYKAGSWSSVPLAAEEIRPKIVQLSKENGTVLAPTTTKPLEWIRKYRKSIKAPAAKHKQH